MSGWDYWKGTFEAASSQASKLAEVVSAQASLELSPCART